MATRNENGFESWWIAKCTCGVPGDHVAASEGTARVGVPRSIVGIAARLQQCTHRVVSPARRRQFRQPKPRRAYTCLLHGSGEPLRAGWDAGREVGHN